MSSHTDTEEKERLDRLERMFFAALEQPEDRRAEFLSEACGSDEQLLSAVEAMLSADEDDAGIIDTGPWCAKRVAERLSAGTHENPVAVPGVRIGSYQLIERIGVGGMGTVWLSRRVDDAFDRTVAIKLIKRGTDSAEILRRFRRERQVLARLEHPNIARLYDGGAAEDGQPYLVMEYVNGTPLDHYCDDKRLPIADRLALFRAVCSAVQHAHRNLVVHRDLKPRNILVTDDGTVKLLDFGIAKLLDAEASEGATEGATFAGRLMTPRYASPEQILGEPITTASDVYSLGVILYELLTGQRPHQLDSDSRAAIEWAVRDDEPMRPSTSVSRTKTVRPVDGTAETRITPDAVSAVRRTKPKQLRRDLRGDLDTIVLTALRKDTQRRYGSVEQFNEDIGRYLTGKPVAAQPNTLRYITGKFIRRNKVLVSGAALLICVLTGWVVTSTWLLADATQAREAESERAFEAERNRDNAEWHCYIANIAAAEAALQTHRPGMARSHLDVAPERLRNWEWRYLRQRLDRSSQVLQNPPGRSHSVAITQDGTRAVGSGGGQIRFWDLSSGEVVRTIDAGGVTQFSLSPDSTRIAWATISGNNLPVRVVDIESGVTVRELTGHRTAVFSLACSPDGRFIAAGTRDGLTMLWDAASGAVLHRLVRPDGVTDRGSALAFSPDSRHLAVGGWLKNIHVWDCAHGELVTVLSGHGGRVLGLAYSPNGTRIASVSADMTVRVWDGLTGEQNLCMYGHTGVINSVAFSPLGDRIVSGGHDQTLRLWDASTGEPLDVLLGHTAPAWSVAWSEDGGTIASTSRDGTVRIWDADPADITQVGGWIYAADVHPSNQLVATGRMIGLVVHDLTTGEVATELEPPRNDRGQQHVFCLDFSSDGRLFAAGGIGSAIRLWSVDTWQEIATFTGHKQWIEAVEISPDGQRIVSGSIDRTARIWNISTGGSVVLEGHMGTVTCAAFSPDGEFVATGSLDHTIRLWDAETGNHIATWGDAVPADDNAPWIGVKDIAFSPDGYHLATGELDGRVAIWDVATGDQLATVDGRSAVFAVAFSPDGSRIASGHEDQTVKLWDVDVAIHRPWLPALVATFREHTDRVNDIVFSSDDELMVSVGRDSRVRLWRTKPRARTDGKLSIPKNPSKRFGGPT